MVHPGGFGCAPGGACCSPIQQDNADQIIGLGPGGDDQNEEELAHVAEMAK